ncbi:putative colanic acid biosynthesis acetyltransferase [Flavobacterium sp. Arc3]|jgi:putative colanic acid biosynthesis acetyltransferase WcaF|uniref:putative colanic acid biosynthesis acetyltransferase n=1 Tax=unclassified Flavobacterium TaxID=196869 RepID=UPI00352F1A9E
MDLEKYSHSFGFKNKAYRLLWNIVYLLLFRPLASRLFKRWHVLVLKCFGAKIKWSCEVNASAKIWAPWNLELGNNCCVGPDVDIYNQGKIRIGDNTIISQKTYLCASSHDYTKEDFPLILKNITIGNGVWVAADAFIGPGVSIGSNAVVAARAVVVKNVDGNTVVGGNPAIKIKNRI